jgi:hypothetical protein
VVLGLLLPLWFGLSAITSMVSRRLMRQCGMFSVVGLPENQAEAIVNSQKALAYSPFVTKSDLDTELMPIKQDITSVKADLKIMMFLIAGMFAGVGVIFMKLFFPH